MLLPSLVLEGRRVKRLADGTLQAEGPCGSLAPPWSHSGSPVTLDLSKEEEEEETATGSRLADYSRAELGQAGLFAGWQQNTGLTSLSVKGHSINFDLHPELSPR